MNILLNICYNLDVLKTISAIKTILYIIIVLMFFCFLAYYIRKKKNNRKLIIILIILILAIPAINISFYTLDKLNVSFAKCFLYANKNKRKKLQKVGIFIGNGGNLNGSNKVTCIGDDACYLKKVPLVQKEGYSFLGWDDNKLCSNPGLKLKLVADTTFFACFDKVTYKLVFDENGGIIEGNNEYILSIDEKYTLNSIPKASKQNYIFLGWANTKTCDSILEEKAITINDNTTYYACYEEIIKETMQSHNSSTEEGVCSNGKKYDILTNNGITTIGGTLIVNKTYSLPSTYDPKGLTNETNNAFNKMKSDALNEGLTIWNQSGYRSYASQDYIYNNYLNSASREYVDLYSARPGHSEHQTGMAIDINDPNDTFLTNYPRESTWVNDNAYKYGFILRYPKGKEKITGYNYESWHFRYVGVDLATKLYNDGSWLTMEEYFCISSKYK